jgi:hypothetical protein
MFQVGQPVQVEKVNHGSTDWTTMTGRHARTIRIGQLGQGASIHDTSSRQLTFKKILEICKRNNNSFE